MDLKELENALIAEGCNPSNYSIGLNSSVSDVFCLAKQNDLWNVFYTERGRHEEPIFSSADEAEACQFFYQYITSMQHQHCVGFFTSEENALKFQQQLSDHVIEFKSDSILYKSSNEKRYRVFVIGKTIFRVREIFNNLPMKD